MDRNEELSLAWKSMAVLLKKSPPEEYRTYRRAIAMLSHDLRQSMGIIYSAESLLRRKYESNPDDFELLDMIRTSSKRAIGLINDLADPFDDQITLPETKQK